jgi:nucleotide-binding universal stress UspA family protein
LRYAVALSRAQEAELLMVHCVDVDDVGEEIIRQAQTEAVDLIVMRSRRRPHRAAILGSTAESVCRNAPCSVLVMHDDERNRVGEDFRINLKRILVAYDFSDYSELALRYGMALAQEHQAELHLLHVLPPRSVSEPEIAWSQNTNDSPYHAAARRLQRVVPAEVHLWCKVKNVVSEGHPYREILSYAEKNEIDSACARCLVQTWIGCCASLPARYSSRVLCGR